MKINDDIVTASPSRPFILIGLIPSLAGLFWMYLDTHYMLTDKVLLYKSAFFKGAIFPKYLVLPFTTSFISPIGILPPFFRLPFQIPRFPASTSSTILPIFFWITLKWCLSSSVIREIASPSAPARPVLPMRCM
jgi:hypothetical protein